MTSYFHIEFSSPDNPNNHKQLCFFPLCLCLPPSAPFFYLMTYYLEIRSHYFFPVD